MIDLYTASTFNGQRVSIMLEETGLDYSVHDINLVKGEQRHPDFLRLNPSGRIPVIVDHDASDKPFVLTQSVAILHYLAEKTGKMLPDSLIAKARVYEWMNFHAIDIGSVLFSAFYLEKRVTPPQPEAAEILRKRIHELYQHFDQQLAHQDFLAGSSYSIADVTTFPALFGQKQELKDYQHLNRWLQQLNNRSAVKRGMRVPNPG